MATKAPVIEINLDERGMGTVCIDGHNIANATYKTTIYSEAGELTRVELELWAHNIKVTAPAEVIAELRDPVLEWARRDLSDDEIEQVASLVADILTDRASRR